MMLDWRALETLIRQDPGKRGLAGFLWQGQWLGEGGLQRAAESLSRRGRRIAIVTGFAIASANPPAAETDGPPGALYLARLLAGLSAEIVLVSDSFGMPLLLAGAEHARLSDIEFVEFPLGVDAAAAQSWVADFFSSPSNRRLTHLVAVERVGPSHTRESVAAQVRSGAPPLADFESETPLADRDRCHNMRGAVIDEHTAPIHCLFSAASQLSGVETIGIADGGNEIGMGCVPWEVLRKAIAGGVGARIACRVPTNHLLVAGISNWGAYALGAAVAALRKRESLIAAWTSDDERRLIESLVEKAGAVDGVTGRPQATVDGVPLDEYLAVFDAIRRATLKGE